MTQAFVERQLPYGVADLFLEEAAQKSRVEAELRAAFTAWSYAEVIPPTFEYYEPLAIEASPQVREETYRFFDRDGRTLALRADPTIPIARIVATKLEHLPLPLRLFYIGSVFRYEEPRASLRREFTQAGIELIGADTAAADAEAVALAVAALRAIGLPDIRLRVGSMELLAALLDVPGLDAAAADAVRVALERKSEVELEESLRDSGLPSDRRAAVARLLQLNGPGPVLEEARTVCNVGPRASAALERLAGTARLVEALGAGDAIVWDLAMVRGMAYYTGIVFEGFAQGLGFAIMSGGRYDNLIAHFGRDLPALGFAIGVERALAALAAHAVKRDPPVTLAPQVYAEMAATRALAGRMAEARARGERVEMALAAHSRKELMEEARARGARQVWFADGSEEVIA